MFQHQLELLPTFLFPQVVSWFAVFPDNVCDPYTLLWITRVEASVSFVCFSINQAARLSVKHSLAHGPHPKHNSYWRSKQRTHNQTQGVCAANLCAHTHTHLCRMLNELPAVIAFVSPLQLTVKMQ